MNRIKRVAISISCIHIEFIGQPFFQNLTGLELQRLVPENAKYIPRNLNQLIISMKGCDVKGPSLNFPNTLASLCILYPDDWDEMEELEQLEISCNFAYLTNLKDLAIYSSFSEHDAIFGFPSSLVTLKFNNIYCGPTEKDTSVCPNLTSICFRSLKLNVNDTHGYSFPFSNKLKELEVSFDFVIQKAIDKYRNMEKLPNRISVEDIFPESLQLLALDKNDGDILNLDTDIDISDGEFLLGLLNLVTLNLHFYPDLPVLELNSPNLRSVIFENSRISKLTPTKLKFPPSVLEIRMCNCGIESIDELFKFPPQLQVLVLSINKLHQPPQNLPSKLKVFGLSHNKFKQLRTIRCFPVSLKFLDISKSRITRHKFGAEYDKLAPVLVNNIC